MPEGFVLGDTISHRNFDESGYMYFPDLGLSDDDKGYRDVQKGYKSIEELVDELNYLDFHVNGNLYDDYYHVLANKERLHSELNYQVDMALNNVITKESFKINFVNYNDSNPEAIVINVEVYRKDFESMLEEINHDTNLKSDVVKWKVIGVIDDYIDELSNNRDDMVSKDTLLELKWRLLQKIK